MKSTSSSPFKRTTQQHTVDTSTKNVSRRRVFRVNSEIIIENVKPIGNRMSIEELIRLQEGVVKKILNIATHDPQI